MNDTRQPEWTLNDGWMLMALYLAQSPEGARLHEIIAAADVTNHAIPTTQELSTSLTKFVQCGLLTTVGERYVIAPAYLPAIEKAYHRRGGLFESASKGRWWLERSKLVRCIGQNIKLSDAQVDLAYHKYSGCIHSNTNP